MARLTADEIHRLGSEFMLDTIKGPLDADLIERVARNINLLWIDSKNAKNISFPRVQRMKDQLFDDLTELIDLRCCDERNNPLNFILTAYETMWRVVKTGFLELYLRDRPQVLNNPVSYATLLEMCMDGELEFNESIGEDDELCPKDVVKEILRLCPPARRVYRHFPADDEHQIADIGACHLLSPLGGDDPDSFRPSRWIQIRHDFEALRSAAGDDKPFKKLKDYEMHLGFMPSGEACPASFKLTEGFWFKMIRLLVITLVCGGRHYGLHVVGHVPDPGYRLKEDAERSRGDGRPVRRDPSFKEDPMWAKGAVQEVFEVDVEIQGEQDAEQHVGRGEIVPLEDDLANSGLDFILVPGEDEAPADDETVAW